MLTVYFGRESAPVNQILDTRAYFRVLKKAWWFEDDFVKSFLRAVDRTEVLFQEALKDEIGNGISTEMISTGCKTLCCLYYDDSGAALYGSAMGDNCIPFYMEIARHKDISLFYEHYPIIKKKYFDEGIVFMNGKVITKSEFENGYADWCIKLREEEEAEREDINLEEWFDEQSV